MTQYIIFIEMTQTTPRTKPVLAGTGKPPVSIPALSPRQREPLSKKGNSDE